MGVVAAKTGRFLEDFEVGDIYRHRRGRTITATDNTWFTLLTLNTNQAHFNTQYAEASEFGRVIVNSGFTLALVLGLTVEDVSENAIANLGWDDITLSAPVYVGDTIWAESIVSSKRDSKSRPHAGIVTVRSRGLNQDGIEVLSYRRTVLVPRSTAALDPFPTPREPLTLAGDERGSRTHPEATN